MCVDHHSHTIITTVPPLPPRQADMDKRRHLNFDTEIKRVELLYACRVGVEVKASQWLKTTSAGPAVLWIPAVHDAKTHRMLEERHSEFEAWKVCGGVWWCVV